MVVFIVNHEPSVVKSRCCLPSVVLKQASCYCLSVKVPQSVYACVLVFVFSVHRSCKQPISLVNRTKGTCENLVCRGATYITFSHLLLSVDEFPGETLLYCVRAAGVCVAF